jgi:hypothetical protein
VSSPSVPPFPSSPHPKPLTNHAFSLQTSTRLQTRSFSSLPSLNNNVASQSATPLAETVRNVASHAQRTVIVDASTEGFKAGVVYTLLAGSVATAGILLLTPMGEREVRSADLL